MSTHGGSMVEIKKQAGKWKVVKGSSYARRITTRTTKMVLSGPAAGNDSMKTSPDPTSRHVTGMLNHCAGGTMPTGGVLTGEENIRGYFWADGDKKKLAGHYKRYGIPGRWYAWGKYPDRFNIDKEATESNRFGYIIEIDPHDPNSVPIKRTALGLFAHEGANVIINADGRVVPYTGGDARFEYLFKFVSAGSYDPKDRVGNIRRGPRSFGSTLTLASAHEVSCHISPIEPNPRYTPLPCHLIRECQPWKFHLKSSAKCCA